MPDDQNRPEAAPLEQVLSEFDQRHKAFVDLCDTTKRLIATILQQRGIRVHSVQERVKDRSKVATKYSDPGKNYRTLNEIPDIIGFRVITYYSDSIDIVKDTLLREFDLIREPDDKRTAAGANEFGYSAVHLDCKYSEVRLKNTEYQRFAKLSFEIQVTSILGHAWAEIHHGWYDEKSGFPRDEERRFHRLAAVLELADQEFVHIRKEKENREKLTYVRQNLGVLGEPTLQELQDFERQIQKPLS